MIRIGEKNRVMLNWERWSNSNDCTSLSVKYIAISLGECVIVIHTRHNTET